MSSRLSRREFLQRSAAAAGGIGVGSFAIKQGALARDEAQREPLFKISLAQWSLHRALKGGLIDPLHFPQIARQSYGLGAVEYVNQFFMNKAKDMTWLGDLKRRADEQGVMSLLIMCDGEGALGDPDAGKRRAAVENHFKWVEAAKFLGCHSIRVNAESK